MQRITIIGGLIKAKLPHTTYLIRRTAAPLSATRHTLPVRCPVASLAFPRHLTSRSKERT